jgi:hypothetical protein
MVDQWLHYCVAYIVVMVMHDVGDFLVKRGVNMSIPPHKVFLDCGVQPLMLGKAVVEVLD